ncbi:hypothetical protein [Gordonia sp. NPDC127522]|uniref:hypothetical protein n=1 Tax=Gordonia sp. NPDC127522 TaxID=3345390 RepID=UPI003644461A
MAQLKVDLFTTALVADRLAAALTSVIGRPVELPTITTSRAVAAETLVAQWETENVGRAPDESRHARELSWLLVSETDAAAAEAAVREHLTALDEGQQRSETPWMTAVLSD